MNQRLVILLAVSICAGAQNSFSVHNLVSDLPGVAEHTDTNLRNPWGLATSGTSPFWISNNHTGTVTVYDGEGNPLPAANPLIVTVPAAQAGGGGPSSLTGQTFNDTGSFELAPGHPALFLFCTEGGAIAGWDGALGGTAVTMVDNSASGAVYKGLAVAQTADGPRLYAANFATGAMDVFDGAFHPVQAPSDLADAGIPGYAPFNVQRLGQRLYVTYAMRDAEGQDDAPGAGHGSVRAFTLEGRLLSRLVEGGALNSPWGLAIAPEYFGPFSQSLLVANFGDGKINAYDSCDGRWLGALMDTLGRDLTLPGLWAIRTGNGHNGGEAGLLYFTAGIPGDADIESHGLFGSLRPAPPLAAAAGRRLSLRDETEAAQ